MTERPSFPRRHIVLALRCLLLLALAMELGAAPVTAPLPKDIAGRLAARAAAARKSASTLRAYLLYREAAKLDPTNANYRQSRDELEPIARLLTDQGLEKADIQSDIEASTLEATPGSDASVAAHLAEKAEAERKNGQPVRAYLLYAAAAQRYPANPSYAENRNVLSSVASLLQQTEADKPDISADLKAAELESLRGADPAARAVGPEWAADLNLAGLPHVQASAQHHDFDLRGTPDTLIRQVASVYGVNAIIDPGLPQTASTTLQIADVDFHTAMEALTLVTHTFVFPVSPQVLFFAEDTEAKRNELEPNVLLTVSLPESLGEKDLVDVANGVRSVLGLKSFGWDSANHTVLIRDKFTRAHLAKSLLQTLLVPHAQVALELQFVTFDSDIQYQFGFSPQTSFQILSPAQKLFNFNTILPTLISGAQYIAFGGGLGTFGIGVTSAQAFATFSKSVTKTVYNTTVVVEDGQTANLHVGEKYPIPQSLYTGASQGPSSIYNPIGTFTQEDLGLVLKVTPHVTADGAISMEIKADYKALGTQTFNTVPAISERSYEGSVTLLHDQWAVLAGLDQKTKANTRSGLPGIGNIPGLNWILSQNNRDNQDSETLVVLKPTVTRLSVSNAIDPQFLLGPERGVRVLL